MLSACRTPVFLESFSMNRQLRRIHWVLSEQFGIDLRRFVRSLAGLPAYLGDLLRYRKMDRGPWELQPCLYDRFEEGGVTRSEYFVQDLHVARKIHAGQPRRHVDIGSRVDGFVAHVASFRDIEVMDIRPVNSVVPGIIFRQADLMSDTGRWDGYCDSLSCLHALEHFGLGRYGDALDAQGSYKGLRNMSRIVAPGGVFYLSVPVGRERTVFNANRILDPVAVVDWARECGLVLEVFAWVMPEAGLKETVEWAPVLAHLRTQDYALGIFTFRRGDS